MDNSESLVQTICQGIFIVIVSVLSLSWLLSKIKKYYLGSGLPGNNEVSEPDGEMLELHRGQKAKSRQKMQEENDFKASDYKERIMIPREQAKRQKKEQDLFKFMGPDWQTEGTVLGGHGSQSDDDDDGENLSEGRKAARKRTIQEQINQKIADKAAAAAAKQKPKRIIRLPEEPDANQGDGVVSIMLRTPIGTVCQRRFYASDKIQCLLDFITTQGFNQRQYRVCMSFPRTFLDDPSSSFSDYNFGKRVALTIEERD